MPAHRSFRARSLLIVTWCALVLGDAAHAAGQTGDARVRAAPSRGMQQGRFRLKDADFFRNSAATVASGVAALKKEGFRGLALDAPKAVSVAERDRCPVVLADIDLARAMVANPLEKHGLLVATELRRHQTFVAPVVQPRNRLVDGRPLGQPSATQVSARSYTVDLRARLGLPWEAGELRAWVLNGERISNQVGISLRSPRQAGPATTPSRSLPPRPTSPPTSFAKTARSPSLPEEPGLRLVAGSTATEGLTLPVYGSFLVPRSAVQLVSAEQQKSYGSPAPFGIVAIALVLTGGESSESSAPEKLEVNVPVFLTDADSPRQDRFAGYFTLDLATHVRAGNRTRPLYLYGFCDGLVAGPTSLPVAK